MLVGNSSQGPGRGPLSDNAGQGCWRTILGQLRSLGMLSWEAGPGSWTLEADGMTIIGNPGQGPWSGTLTGDAGLRPRPGMVAMDNG